MDERLLADVRKEAMKAILDAGFQLLVKRQSDEPAGKFLIALMWALEESRDGLRFDIEQAEENARRG
jgi:hypothetical protein